MPTTVESQDKSPLPINKEKELELGDALTLIIKTFRKLGRLMARLGEAVIAGLVFIKRRLWWILLAIVIGLGWGACESMKGGNSYKAEMTARFNYESTITLYGSIDYLNGLIGDARYDLLATLFSISRQEAAALLNFSAAPVKDPLIIADLYRQQYLDFNRSMLVRLDTLWPRMIPFNDFKKGLTSYNIPLQQITVFTRRPDIFPQLQKGLIHLISSNAVLQKKQLIKDQLQAEEENILLSSLQGLDTLRAVYNERIRNTLKRQENSSTNISLLDQSLNGPAPELALYDKTLLFRDELKRSRQNAMNNQDIVQVYVPFNQYGKKVHSFVKSCAVYALKALAAILLILLVIEFYQFIDRREKEQRLLSRSGK
jgi:hypothetical protein